MALKARGLMAYVTGKKPQPKESDSSFDNWDQQNSQTMSLLYASLDPTLVASYVLYETAADLWEAIKLTYFQTDNYAEVFDIHQKLKTLKHGDLTVVEYINEITAA